MVARWREMAVYTDRHLDSLRRSLDEGRVACLAPGERTVAILEDLLDGETADWPLLAPLADVADLPGWSAAQRERFTADLTQAVDDEIRPAFIRLHDALVTEILPRARSAEHPGMCHVPEGPEGYRRLIRVHTSLDLDAAEIHQIGLDEIARIDVELAELAGRAIGAASLRRGPRPAAQRSRAVLLDPRRDLRRGGGVPRPGHRGDPRLVRPPADRGLRRHPDGPARGRPLDDRLLPPARDRRLAARPVLPQHRGAGDAAALRGSRRSPTTSRSRAITSRSRSARSCRTCRSSGATSGRPRSSRAGACTPSAWATRWASTAATSTGSACCRTTPGGRPGSSSTPGSTRWAGRATGRSRSCSSTRRSRPTTSPTRSTATSCCPARRSPTRSASSRSSACGPRRGRRSATGSTSAASTTRSSAAARSPCRRCAASSRPGPTGRLAGD